MQGNGVGWTEGRLVRITYQPEIIHLILGGSHGAYVPAVEVRPHRAAEEIDAPDADLFIKQQFHMRMFGFEPCPESFVLFIHRPLRVIFVVSCHIRSEDTRLNSSHS